MWVCGMGGWCAEQEVDKSIQLQVLEHDSKVLVEIGYFHTRVFRKR